MTPFLVCLTVAVCFAMIAGTVVTLVLIITTHDEREREAEREQERKLAGIAATVARTSAPAQLHPRIPRPPS